jgi:hypothetical protein
VRAEPAVRQASWRSYRYGSGDPSGIAAVTAITS